MPRSLVAKLGVGSGGGSAYRTMVNVYRDVRYVFPVYLRRSLLMNMIIRTCTQHLEVDRRIDVWRLPLPTGHLRLALDVYTSTNFARTQHIHHLCQLCCRPSLLSLTLYFSDKDYVRRVCIEYKS